MSDAVTRVSVEIEGKEISFETGKLAKQASGAVVVQSGETMVLCTATAGNLRDVDFLPLTVDVEERMYAAGKIPGSFFKREGRAGEKGTLTARLIDRPIRPLFPKGWRHETQLVALPMSVDHVNPYDMLALNGASAALMVSNIPFPGPVGAVRIGKIDGNFVVNPDEEALLDGTDLDLIVAGTEDAILMVEAGANEIPEAEILDALDIAHENIRKLCAAQRELAEKAGKPKTEVEVPQVHADLYEQIRGSHGAALDTATQVEDKLERQAATKAVEEQVLEHYSGDPDSDTYAEYRANAQRAFDKLEKTLVRERIAVAKKRPDGRGTDEIRPISIEVDVAPRTHGSALFTRGQTQAFSVATLGTTREEMRLDTLGLETTKRYFHHYNFPPFSVGEAGFMRGPKRRDIGHGALAERALVPMIPSQEDFPYTIRVVSDILESNGSSSMASVCGSTLSLLAAGVPIKAPVAGIAMGLIKEGDDYVILTDIAGVEDHLGDMDFKVAGTSAGITALQMDIKITGVTFEIMRDALAQAKVARSVILGKMAEVIDTPRSELSKYAPGISSVKIDPEKIGLLIGKGGETIRALQEEFESQIDVNDEGQVLVYASNRELGDALVARISSMTKEVEVGDEFTGKIVKTTTFGAFVELSKGTDGLLHISNVAPGRRIATVEEVFNKGDEVAVKVVEVDRERGRIGLRLADDPEIQGKNPEELAQIAAAEASRPRGGGGDRNRDRGPGGPRSDRGGPRNGREGGNRDRDPGRDRDRDAGRVRDPDPERPRS
jgi:polyribonucleotide nucleotidyltransferase